MSPSTSIELPGLINRLKSLPRERRHLIALAGPPGSGKSTLADEIVTRINASRPGAAAVVGMDGFHYDNIVLGELGLLAKKGSPDTFDVDGLQAMLVRLKAGREAVATPVFDRSIEIARAAAQIVSPATGIVLVEGNYLLLGRPRWRSLGALFDLRVMIAASAAMLHRRLVDRWLSFGFTFDAAVTKVESNDLPNAKIVIGESVPADLTLNQHERV
jgi:pantothenate kinase